ncbi:MAG: ATPase, T2SS/T4P/T4SS family [Deltaproteobacteria bacterium]|nr:ATPase, T2SS/T4P/T4SS family [Deltaproteobacteria bacterium]
MQEDIMDLELVIEDNNTPPAQTPGPASVSDELTVKAEEAALYAKQGLVEEAIEIYEDILFKLTDITSPLYKDIEARLQRLRNTSGEAQGHANDIPTDSSSPQDLFEKNKENALGLKEAGFYHEAITDFSKLLELTDRPGEIYAQIGECYVGLNMPFDALEQFGMALKDTTLPKATRLELLYKLSTIHERTGAIQAAISSLEQLVHLDPQYMNAAQRLRDLTQTAQRYGRFSYLVTSGILREQDLQQAREIAKNDKKSIEFVLINSFGIDKKDIGYSLSEYFKLPFVEFNELEVGATPKCLTGIKEHFLRNISCVPIKDLGSSLLVAVDDPHDYAKLDSIRKAIQFPQYEFAVCLKEDIDKFIDYFYGKYTVTDESQNVFEEIAAEELTETDEEEESIAPESDSVVVQLVNQIIEDAYAKNASDIHVESLTGKRGALIRLRVDGDCRPYKTVPYNYKKALVSRIKILSNLDIAEKRLPQDGKIKFKSRTGKTIELRVATLPTTEDNEDVVMRILAASTAMPLDKLNLSERNLATMKQVLEMPYGLILCVGPTGSGKTTTLHAALGYVNRPEKKIWTAEDPVEIVQEGLRQVQVKPAIGLTFARVLRAFLRADPDIIMVGETRDEETATTVIEASLTGHLVFSTLHTNSAPETVTRLLGMGMDPFNFSDALLCVLAQRLLKRLCPKCKEQYEPSAEEKEMLIKEYGMHPTVPLEFKNYTMYRPVGCQACNYTGYKGRMAIHELLTSDDEMKKLIQAKAPVFKIGAHAMQMGMLTLKQDGIWKILQGHTDIKQVRGVCIK